MPERGPRRGDIWLVDLNPVRGHEQAGVRPALIVSVDAWNAGPAGLVVGLPLTRTHRGIPSHIPVLPPEGGLRSPSYIKCEDVRSLARVCLIERWGAVSAATMGQVKDWLRVLLGL